jgi:hypothetical protein
LRLALQCKSWDSLPYPGGILDQPYGLLERMTLAYNVYTSIKGQQAASDLVKWAEANPEAADTYAMVRELQKHATD